MGADTCHFAGVFRPTAYLPMPTTIPDIQLDAGCYPCPCPCSLFTANHPSTLSSETIASDKDQVACRTQPFYNICTTPGSVYANPADAQGSVDKIKVLDAHSGVFVCMAHDHALFDVLPLYNSQPDKDINGWQALDYKGKIQWAFLNELPKGSEPGRDILVRGLRRSSNAVMEWHEGEGFLAVSQTPGDP